MKTNSSYETDVHVYPGEYVPLRDPEELLQSSENKTTAPDINLKESSNFFFAELIIPGLQREDFQVMVEDELITICVFKEGTKDDRGVFFDQYIHLPANSDPQFASAEYRSGILSLRIPKTQERIPCTHSMIVVY